jgi:hypothetical protein
VESEFATGLSAREETLKGCLSLFELSQLSEARIER